MPLTCEKLIHGHRKGRPVVDKKTKKPTVDEENGKPKIVGESKHHPYRCERPASRLKVSGQSFSAFATLCELHKRAAEREGFKIEVVAGTDEQSNVRKNLFTVDGRERRRG